MQTFKSEYLFRRAERMMKRKGYYAGVRREYCGMIEVEWRLTPTPKGRTVIDNPKKGDLC